MRTILVIEDNPLHGKLFSELFRHYGYRVVVVCGGQEGLSFARRERPDLMVIDCYLPSERALQTLRVACGDRILYPMPIIATSAFADESESEAFQALGCAAYVPKPVSVGPLIATVKRVLDESGLSGRAVRTQTLAPLPTGVGEISLRQFTAS